MRPPSVVRAQKGRPSSPSGFDAVRNQQTIARAIDEVIRARGNSALAKQRQAKRSFPAMPAISGVVEPRRPGVHGGHAQGHREVGMREVNPAGAIAPGLFLQPRRGDSMKHLAGWNKRTVQRRIFNGPRLAAVADCARADVPRVARDQCCAVRRGPCSSRG